MELSVGVRGKFLKGLEIQLNRILEGKTVVVVVVAGLDIAPRLLGHVEPRGGRWNREKGLSRAMFLGSTTVTTTTLGRWMFGEDHHRGYVKGKFSEQEEAHGKARRLIQMLAGIGLEWIEEDVTLRQGIR